MYIDTYENAIDSLESVVLFLQREDNLKWKWIVLSLYHCLYMFCVANLQGTNYNRVISKGKDDEETTYIKKDNEKWKRSKKIKISERGAYKLEWKEIESEPIVSDGKVKYGAKREKLIGFWTALARVQDGECWMYQYIFSNPLELTEHQLISIEYLVEYRNEYSHFIPISSMSGVKKFAEIGIDVLDVIKFLALETGNILYHDHEEAKMRINKSIDIIKEKFNKIIKNENN